LFYFIAQPVLDKDRQASMKNKKGFTLIEVLVVIGVLTVVAGLGASIFSSLLRSYNKAHIVNELEQNGNFVLSIMEQQIRNAVDVREITNGIELTLRDGTTKKFEYVPDNCSSGSNGYITDSAGNVLTGTDVVTGVNITSASFVVNDSGTDLPKTVDISLTVSQACDAPDRLDYQAQAHMQTTVLVRAGYE
jgi:prepilin-type N-terminal cleavage/methylation domain-containing protein